MRVRTIPSAVAALALALWILAPASAGASDNGEIHGYKFHDLNGNGVEDGGEPRLEGWVIELMGTDSSGNTVSLTQTTNVDGEYWFTGLTHGTYQVREVLQPGWVQTTSNPSDIMSNDDVQTADPFGNAVPGSIHGFKFNDADADGVYEPSGGDVPFPGIDFVLTGIDGMGNPVGPLVVTTDGNGAFWFENLLPGTYTVSEATGSLDPSVMPSTATSVTLTVNSQEELVWQDGAAQLAPGDPQVEVNVGDALIFGNFVKGSIHGFKWHDLDGDGLWDVGEPGLNGWTIFVDANDNGLFDVGELSTVTMNDGVNDGAYWFDSLVPDTYGVREELQPGWSQAFPGLPAFKHQVTLASGQAVQGRFEETEAPNFGNFVVGSIHGYKFNDLNANGVDDGEPRLQDVTITLTGTDGMGNAVGPVVVTTDANGEYWFTDLLPGEYTVTETPPAGTVPTTAPSVDVTIASGEEDVALAGQAGTLTPPKFENLNPALAFGNSVEAGRRGCNTGP